MTPLSCATGEMLDLHHRIEQALQRPITDQAAAAALADRLVSVRAALARNPTAPAELLRVLAKDRPTVLLGLAGNPALPADVFEAVFADAQQRWGRGGNVARDTLQRLAANPSCPLPVMARLAAHPSRDIAAHVAANPSVPISALRDIAATDAMGATYAARNPICPADLLHDLARDTRAWVRYGAVLNPHLADDDLVHLVADPSAHVRDHATDVLLARPYRVQRDALLAHGTSTRLRLAALLGARAIRALARDDDARLRSLAARVTGDPGLLSRLATDPDRRVRRQASRRVLSVA